MMIPQDSPAQAEQNERDERARAAAAIAGDTPAVEKRDIIVAPRRLRELAYMGAAIQKAMDDSDEPVEKAALEKMLREVKKRAAKNARRQGRKRRGGQRRARR